MHIIVNDIGQQHKGKISHANTMPDCFSLLLTALDDEYIKEDLNTVFTADNLLCVCMCLCVCVYVYIFTIPLSFLAQLVQPVLSLLSINECCFTNQGTSCCSRGSTRGLYLYCNRGIIVG